MKCNNCNTVFISNELCPNCGMQVQKVPSEAFYIIGGRKVVLSSIVLWSVIVLFLVVILFNLCKDNSSVISKNIKSNIDLHSELTNFYIADTKFELSHFLGYQEVTWREALINIHEMFKTADAQTIALYLPDRYANLSDNDINEGLYDDVFRIWYLKSLSGFALSQVQFEKWKTTVADEFNNELESVVVDLNKKISKVSVDKFEVLGIHDYGEYLIVQTLMVAKDENGSKNNIASLAYVLLKGKLICITHLYDQKNTNASENEIQNMKNFVNQLVNFNIYENNK